MHRRKSQSRSGFSLVELMIIITVMGIIGALAMPMLRPNHATKLRAPPASSPQTSTPAGPSPSPTAKTPGSSSSTPQPTPTTSRPSSAPATPITHPTMGGDYTVTFGTGDTAQLDGVTIQSVSVGGDDQLGFGIYGQLDQPTDATITLASGGTTITLTLDAPTGEVMIGELE